MRTVRVAFEVIENAPQWYDDDMLEGQGGNFLSVAEVNSWAGVSLWFVIVISDACQPCFSWSTNVASRY